MKVPKEFKDVKPFKGFKPKCSDRIFESEPPPSTIVIKKEESERYKNVK